MNYLSTQRSDFIEEALKIHNEFRSKHSAPPLIINKELNQISLEHAEKMAKLKTFYYSVSKYQGKTLGENLYTSQGSQIKAKEMTELWYNEKQNYDYNKNTYTPGADQFTQITWINSREVGFGYAQGENGIYYAVANYYPCGNVIGQFAQNVKAN